MLNRQVEINSVIYDQHEVTAVNSIVGLSSVVFVKSSNLEEKNTTNRSFTIRWRDGATVAEIEEELWALPAFDEYVDSSGMLQEVLEILTDEQAATVPQAYREWQPDTAYAVGDRRRHEDKLYKCIQPHTSQADQTPDVAVSLWALIIASDDPSNPLPWVQPDSTNGYSIGNRVTHNGQVWESDYDNNVWEPGIYGWHIVET